jgi:tyrosinase
MNEFLLSRGRFREAERAVAQMQSKIRCRKYGGIMQDHPMTRRDFLYGATAGTIALAAATGGCERVAEEVRNRPTRRNIANLGATDPIIQSYKAAVTAMRALPNSDRRSWTRQAQIHLDHCPHGNWFFLPWHRAYLLYFETICRQLSDNADFALPYWNWAANRSVPAPFWGGGASNPLLHSPRTAGPSSTAADAFVSHDVMDGIQNEPNFLLYGSGQSATQRGFSAYGRLEGTPHNYIHGFVGGTMGTFDSPLDPVFWTHHNMIDYCWVDWNINRNHPNTNDTAWTNFAFNDNFVDKDGNSVNVTVASTLLMPLLSYRYEDSQIGLSTSLQRQISSEKDARDLEKFVREGAKVTLEFTRKFELKRSIAAEIGKPASEPVTIEPEPAAAALRAENKQRVLLTLNGVQLPSTTDIFVRVFINKPDANENTPITDPNYAGSFAFFGGAHVHVGGPKTAAYIVDITNTLRRLNQGGALSSTKAVTVQLVVAPFPERQPSERTVRLQGLEVGIGSFSR